LARSVRLWLVALTMIPAIDRHYAMVFGEGFGDAVGEPVSFGATCVAVNQDDRRTLAHFDEMNLDSIRRGKGSIRPNRYRGQRDHGCADSKYAKQTRSAHGSHCSISIEKKRLLGTP